jgi:hypothetical protein
MHMTAVITWEMRHRLMDWLDRGITSGTFRLPSGRHIVLNENRCLVRLARFKASAGVDEETLLAFLKSISPDVGIVRSCKTVLSTAPTGMISLCYCESEDTARSLAGRWHVATPPLSDLRKTWAALKAAAAQPAGEQASDVMLVPEAASIAVYSATANAA